MLAEALLPNNEDISPASACTGAKKPPESREITKIEGNIWLYFLTKGFIKQTDLPRDFLPKPYKTRLELQDDLNCAANKGSHDGYLSFFHSASSYSASLQETTCLRVSLKSSKVNETGENSKRAFILNV
jgi:hypothetical protein